jgi:hypothetical protein
MNRSRHPFLIPFLAMVLVVASGGLSLTNLRPDDVRAAQTDLAAPATVIQGDSTPVVISVGEVGLLKVATRICPTDFDTMLTREIAELERQCTGVPSLFLHQLLPPDAELSTVPDPEAVNEEEAITTFAVAPGRWWVLGWYQTPPFGVAGYRDLAVACTTPPGTTAELVHTVHESYIASAEVIANKVTSCTRYINLSQATGSVVVHLAQCAAGYDLDSADADPATACDQPLDDIQVMLSTGQATQHLGLNERSGLEVPGRAFFEDVIPGPYRLIAEMLPYRTFVDWHYAAACDEDPILVLDESHSVGLLTMADLTVPSGDTVSCTIYAMPPADASE